MLECARRAVSLFQSSTLSNRQLPCLSVGRSQEGYVSRLEYKGISLADCNFLTPSEFYVYFGGGLLSSQYISDSKPATSESVACRTSRSNSQYTHP